MVILVDVTEFELQLHNMHIVLLLNSLRDAMPVRYFRIQLFFFFFYFSFVVILIILTMSVPYDRSYSVVIECHFPDERNSTCEILTPLILENDLSFNILPVQNASAVIELRLTQPSRLYRIPRKFFTAFPRLRKVEMNRAGIITISAVDFLSAAELVHLELFKNNMKIISRAVFSTLSKLEELKLNYSNIERIENYAFVNLTRLKKLSLAGNKLEIITPWTLAGAKNLEILDLDHNDLHVIADGALRLPKLVSLWIGFNRLSVLPDRFCSQAPILEDLRFACNQISLVANSFYGCSELTYLNGDNNLIEDLQPNAMNGMTSLAIASFNNNRLTFNASDMGDSSDLPLFSLDLSGNHLSDANIFEKLIVFSNLELIKLNDNDFSLLKNIEEIPKWFPLLHTIEMYNNSKIHRWAMENEEFLERSNIELYTDDNLNNY